MTPSLPNRRYFLRFSGEQGQARGERGQARGEREVKNAKKNNNACSASYIHADPEIPK